MKSPHPIGLAVGSLLVALTIASGPANALATVFWDRENFGSGAGRGVTLATANNAETEGGIPTVELVDFDPLFDAPEITHTLNVPSLVLGDTATITSNWKVTNDTGTTLQDLYLVFAQPIPTTITLDGESTPVSYDPADVGLTLGAGWVIFQVDLGSIPVYYPAVSLGTLANGANAEFPLLYVLDNPQVFRESFNFELGMPKWKTAFITTTPIPEPSTAWLVLVGLLGIAGRRHKRS